MPGPPQQKAGPSFAMINGPGASEYSGGVSTTQHLKSTCLPSHLKLPLINDTENLINENQQSCACRYLGRLTN